MSSSQNTCYDLTFFEKKTLSESRRYAKGCMKEIAKDMGCFASKGRWGLYWDSKGLFRSSDKAEVIANIQSFESLHEKIDDLTARVEKGDPKSYDYLLSVYQELEEMEKESEREVKNNSKTYCRMLREFLNKKYKIDHNLKKIECIVLKQKMHAVEQTCNRAAAALEGMNKKMDSLMEENRTIRKDYDHKLKYVLMEAEERSDARFLKMREESERHRLEAKRIQRESDEKLKQAVEEANRLSEARMREMTEQLMMRMFERMNVQ